MKNPKVSIVIVNYNSTPLLQNALVSIQENVSISHEVIVVDNKSKDFNLNEIQTVFPDVHFIQSASNLGFAAGNNLALPFVKGEYLFYLNPDTLVHPGTLETLCDHLDTFQNIGAVAPKLVYESGQLQRSIRPFYHFWSSLFDNRFMNPVLAQFPFIQKWMPLIKDHSKAQLVDWVKGAAFLVRTSLVQKLKGFDEQFWIYGEEIDMCKRIWDESFKIFYDPSVSITHLEGQSTRQSSSKMFIQNYKSFYLFLKKHYSQSSLRWYHNRVSLFAKFWLIKASISKKNSLVYEQYQELIKWLNTEGKQLVQS